MDPINYLENASDELVLKQTSIKNTHELLNYVKASELTANDREKIYGWIKNSIKDPVLSRNLRKLKSRNNFVEFLEKRINYLNDVKKGLIETKQQINQELYVCKSKLILDKEKCIHCDISHTVCPKESVEVDAENITVDNTCVLCGICVPFCPTGALEMVNNENAQNLIKDSNPLPQLPEAEEINGVMIKRIFDGSIAVDESKCPDDCEYCVAACPIGVIERDGKKVEVDRNLCLYCSACQHACPKDAITIKRNKIYHKEGFSAVWTKSIEKFLGVQKVNVALNHNSMKKIKSLVSDMAD